MKIPNKNATRKRKTFVLPSPWVLARNWKTIQLRQLKTGFEAKLRTERLERILPAEHWITKDELAARLSITRRGVESLMARRKIPFKRVSHRMFRFNFAQVANALRKYDVRSSTHFSEGICETV